MDFLTLFLVEELLKTEATSQIDQAEYAQPLCTALQIAISNLLALWGVRPSSVVGHSSGEVAAAYAAGAITAKTAIAISYYRGQVMKQVENSGAMAAVGISNGDVQPYLEDGVVVACENSSRSITLSGDSDRLDRTLERMKSDHPDIFCRRLRVEAAYHSREYYLSCSSSRLGWKTCVSPSYFLHRTNEENKDHMKKIGDAYENLIDPMVRTNLSMVPMYSTVTGQVILDPRQLQAGYWRQNLESPVLFRSAIKKAMDDTEKNHVFLEIGPHSALSGPLRHIFNEEDRKIKLEYVPTLLRGQDQDACLLAAAGRLYLCHLPVDLATINGRGSVLTDIPPYPWRHDKKYWHESRLTKEWRLREFPHHELLGSRLPGSTDLEPTWRNILRLENIPWVWDHRAGMDIVFPAAGYITMAGEAIRQISKVRDYTIRNMFIKTPLTLKETTTTEVITSLKPARLTNSLDLKWYEFTISAYANDKWFKCCIGIVRAGKHGEHLVKEIQTFPRLLEKDLWYETLRDAGVEFGPRFRRLENISTNPLKQEAAAMVETNEQDTECQYTLHPVLIDQGFQLVGIAASQGLIRRSGTPKVPVSIEEVYINSVEDGFSLAASLKKVSNEKQRFSTAAEAFAISKNTVTFSMKGVVFVAMTYNADLANFSIPLASRIDWQPDIDFVPGKGLISPAITTVEPMDLLVKLILLTAIEIASFAQDSNPDSKNTKQYETWVNSNLARVQEIYSMVPECGKWKPIEMSNRQELFDELRSAAGSSSPEMKPFGRILRKILDALEDEISPMEYFMADEGWKALYEFAGTWSDWTKFLALMGHSNPSMKVLEIGAGVGGATAAIVHALYTKDKVRQYGKYVFSDACHDRVAEAKEMFSQNDGFEFTVLDINQNPLEQGFEKETYDLIIVSDVGLMKPAQLCS